jgi:4'-phosphopantetheinyl transferase
MELLPLNAVHVDIVDPNTAEAWAQHEAYRALMSADEHERMGRLIFERDRRRFLITRALVRTALSRYGNVAPADWKFKANVHGRPEILDRPPGVPDLRFNISHTDGLIACAITVSREVGVDVEHIGRRLTHDIAARFFAPSEVADLKSLPPDEQARMFFDYWTLKEAYIKARGMGLALPLADFAFILNPLRAPRVTFEPTLDDDATTWQFAQAWPTPLHRLGLAVRRTGRDLPIRIRHVIPQLPGGAAPP